MRTPRTRLHMSPAITASTFIRPGLNLGYGNDTPDGVNSLPELIEFAAEHNPDHIFVVQARAGDAAPCYITFSDLKFAVERAAAWLVSSGITTGRISRDEVVQPVAILLGSDISIFIYMAALLWLGTPVCIHPLLRCLPILLIIRQRLF